MEEPEARIDAGDRGYEESIQQLGDRVKERFRYHTIDLPDGSVLPGLQSLDHLRWRLDLFGLPKDLRGKRVLDVGAWDGWFSFECERRGAKVVAVDCVALDTFLEAKRLIGSQVEYLTLDVNELSPERLGRFDIVLFFGVLYHLRHPLLGLERAVELCTDVALIESFVIRPEDRQIPSMLEFYERAELGGQIDNWFGPSPECLVSMCRSAGFVQVELKDVTNQRASLVCRRRWPEPDTTPVESPPQLHAVVNNRTYVAKFHPHKDEYLCCYFKSAEPVSVDNLFVEVDGFGTHALVVAESEGGYQANCLRPPGLEPGRHAVRIRSRHSGRSNAVGFTMLDEANWLRSMAHRLRSMARRFYRGKAAEFMTLDETGRDAAMASAPLPVGPPELCSAEFRMSGDLRMAVDRGGTLVCYFRSPAESVGAGDVKVDIEGWTTGAHTVSALGDNVWQANILLERPIAEGSAVRVRLGEEGEWSPASRAREKG